MVKKIDWIQGEKFIKLADFIYSPKYKLPDDYDRLYNTFNLFNLKNINIVYTHTFYVKQLFQIIAELDKKFIIITHNSVINIDKSFIITENVIKWYSKNVNVNNFKIESIPLGLENNRWFIQIHKKEKMIELLNQPKKIKNLVYMNHNIKTNPDKRKELYQIFKRKSWVTIDHGSNGYKFDKYIDNVYNHKFVICPEGNGMDTVRTWECLYMETIPIEKRNINNQFYTDLPICFVDDWKEITEDFLENEYIRIKQFIWNMKKLSFEYWKNKILSYNENQ